MLVSGIKGAAMDSVGRIWRKIRGLGIGVLLATGALWHSGTVAAEYLVSFETDTDTSGGSELAFVTYSSYADLLADNNSVTTLSPINVAAPFSTTGLMSAWQRDGGSVPEPASLTLIGLGALMLLAIRVLFRRQPWNTAARSRSPTVSARSGRKSNRRSWSSSGTTPGRTSSFNRRAASVWRPA